MANISLGVDLPALQNDLNSAVSAISNASKGIASEADKANEKIKQGAQGAASGMGSLQTQFRAAQKEALTLAGRFGVTSDAAIQAAKRAGELKDQVNETKMAIGAFSNDSTFTAVAGSLKAAAGAASLVTGAMGLLGVKSEETQQMLLKVQSVLAITQGLSAIGEMKDSFVALSAVIKLNVIPALATLKGALMATGIVAIAAAVAMLAYNWYETSEAEKAAANEAANYAETLKAVIAARKGSIDAQNKLFALQISTMKDGREKDLANAQLQYQIESAEYKNLVHEKKITLEQGQQAQKFLLDKWNSDRFKINADWNKKDVENAKRAEEEKVKAAVEAAKRAENSLKFKTEIEFAQTFKMPKIDIGGLDKAFKDKSIKANIDVQIADDALASSKLKIEEQLKSMKETLIQGVQGIGLGFTNALGESFVTGELDLRGIYQMFSQLANAIAMQLIAIGTPLLFTPATFGLGMSYIGAGAALGLVAGVASGLAKSSGSGNQNTTTVAPQIQSPNMNGFRNQNDGMDMKTKVKGSDLLIIVDGAGRIRRR